MSERYAGYYQPRNRARNGSRKKKEEQQADTIVVSLTAQILVCILLVAALGIVSRVNTEGFQQFRDTYDSMSREASGNEFNNMIVQWSQQDGIVGSVGGMLIRWFGVAESLEAGNRDSEKDILPEPEDDITESASDAFEYSYLMEAQPAEGGLNPVMVSAGVTQQLAVPQNSILSSFAAANQIQPPVSGKITSRYAYRIHPITEKTDFHNGIDIAAEEGRAIVAAMPGEVVEVGESDIYGNYITLQHSASLKTFYAHCSEIIAQEGMIVRQGERIAKVGQTGMATGPHLHFSVVVNNLYTDPFYVLGDHITIIGESEGDA